MSYEAKRCRTPNSPLCQKRNGDLRSHLDKSGMNLRLQGKNGSKQEATPLQYRTGPTQVPGKLISNRLRQPLRQLLLRATPSMMAAWILLNFMRRIILRQRTGIFRQSTSSTTHNTLRSITIYMEAQSVLHTRQIWRSRRRQTRSEKRSVNPIPPPSSIAPSCKRKVRPTLVCFVNALDSWGGLRLCALCRNRSK